MTSDPKNYPMGLVPVPQSTSTTTTESSSSSSTSEQQQGVDPRRLNNLFYWAIQNSDLNKLKENAAHADPDKVKKNAEMFFGAADSVPTQRTIDPSKLLKQQVERLSSSDVTNEERYNCMMILQDLIDKIDFANDFHKLNGTNLMLDIIKNYLSRDEFDEEWYTLAIEACECISTCLQNNPWLQLQDQYQNHVLPFIFETAKSERVQSKHKLLEKLISMLSALSSNQPVTLIKFLELDGVNQLIVPLVTMFTEKSSVEWTRLTSKCMFLLFNLSVAEESLPSKTVLLPMILDNHDLLIERVLQRNIALSTPSEIDVTEKTLLLLRDLSQADHVSEKYKKVVKNSTIPSLIEQITRNARQQEDQDIFYDIFNSIEEIQLQ